MVEPVLAVSAVEVGSKQATGVGLGRRMLVEEGMVEVACDVGGAVGHQPGGGVVGWTAAG